MLGRREEALWCGFLCLCFPGVAVVQCEWRMLSCRGGFLVSVEHAGLWGAEFGDFLCVSGTCWRLGSRVFGISGRCWAPGTGFSV